MNMCPKNRNEISKTCFANFLNYSTSTKIAIICSILLCASTFFSFFYWYIFPTVFGINAETIVGWDIVWRIGLGFIIYEVVDFLNTVFVCMCGRLICDEENWEIDDFIKAWCGAFNFNDEEN